MTQAEENNMSTPQLVWVEEVRPRVESYFAHGITHDEVAESLVWLYEMAITNPDFDAYSNQKRVNSFLRLKSLLELHMFLEVANNSILMAR